MDLGVGTTDKIDEKGLALKRNYKLSSMLQLTGKSAHEWRKDADSGASRAAASLSQLPFHCQQTIN